VSKQLDDIDKKGQSTSKSMGLSFGNIASAALKVASVIGLGMGINGMVAAADVAEKNMAQLNAVLKSTGGVAGVTKQQALDLATSLGNVTTFGKQTTLSVENLLLTFTKIGSKIMPEVTEAALNMATTFHEDASSAAIQLGKAMNDPVAGVTALRRVGVMLTAQQQEQVKAMVKVGDVAGAQKVILAELATETGGSARAAGETFSGQMAILGNAITGTGGAMVNSILPAITTFVNMINNNMPKAQKVITDVINTIVPKFQEWIKLIGQIVSELFPNFGKQVDGVKGQVSGFSGVLDGITNVLKFVKDNIDLVKAALVVIGVIWVIQTGFVVAHNVALIAHNVAHAAAAVALGVTTAAQWLFNAATGANPIGAIILLIVGLIAVVILIATHWTQVSAVLMSVWKVIVGAFDTSIKAIVGFFQGLWNGITGIFGGIGKWLTSIFDAAWNGIKSGFSSVINFMINGLNMFIKGFLSPFNLIIKGLNLLPNTHIPELNIAIPNIPRFDVGSRYLPEDMFIQAHKGEMIVPKSENPYANSGGKTMPQNTGDMVFNFDMGGGVVKTVRLTSQQIAAQQRQRTSYKAVIA
jgi:hypothetical protein